MNIQLSNNGHKLGRCVEDSRFQINSAQISATHCHIYKASASKFYVNDTRFAAQITVPHFTTSFTQFVSNPYMFLIFLYYGIHIT